MRPCNLVSVALIAASLTMAPRSARAQVTQYTTLAGFLSATITPRTDTYSDVAQEFIATPLNRTVGMYSYTLAAPEGLFGTGTPANPMFSTNTATDPLTLSNFSNTVRGVGGNFFASDFNGAPASGDIRIDFTVLGEAPGFFTIVNATTGSFFGIVSRGGAITSFAVTAIQGDVNAPFLFPTVDNLVLASVVPEPESYALMAIGLIMLGLVSRRRRGRRA